MSDALTTNDTYSHVLQKRDAVGWFTLSVRKLHRRAQLRLVRNARFPLHGDLNADELEELGRRCLEIAPFVRAAEAGAAA